MDNFIEQLVMILLAMCAFGICQSLLNRPLKTKERGKNGQIIYRSLSVDDAKNAFKEKNVTLIDVRSPDEYQLRHLKRSKLVPIKTIAEAAPKKLKRYEDKVLVYCQSGNRSKKAVKKLYEMGYQSVYDIGAMNQFSDFLDK